MKRFILTGTPGSGKTSILQALGDQGHTTIPEGATDVIAFEQALGIDAPWQNPTFLNQIVTLQKERQTLAVSGEIQFYDRSPLCTLALARYLGFDPSSLLMQEIERIQSQNIYETTVFFIQNLGFITPTDARQISYEESLKFEKIHLEVYQEFGYTCLTVPSGTILERVETILKNVR